jgi:hydroxypyruvate isomerase
LYKRNRRQLLIDGAVLALASQAWTAAAANRGRLKQAVARVVFGDLPLDRCCQIASRLGIEGFDFISDPNDWPLLRRFGLTMSMLRADYGGGISIGRTPPGPPGWGAIGSKESQGAYRAAIEELIQVAAAQRFPNIIVTAGTRDGVTNEQGADNAVEFLNLVKPLAESKGVTLCMELLNSFGNQAPRNSLFDHAAWGTGVVRRVDSANVKILYDVWHAQLMEGNITQTLRDSIPWIGHIHLGAVPARHELFRDDELDYHSIARTIADLGFRGYVTHEWSPSAGSDIAEDLKRSVQLVTV